MYTLFGVEGSGSAAIEIALSLCAAPYTLTSACSWEDGPGREALQRVNPLLQVPVLVLPDGSVITESVAILIHLGLAFPDSGLLPVDASERSQTLRALVYIAANCYAAIGIIDYPERWLPDADQTTRAELEKGARQCLYRHWDLFSDLFCNPAAWHPETPGALEVLASVVTRWSGTREHLHHSRPGFHASLVQIDAHPVVSEVLRRHWPASSDG